MCGIPGWQAARAALADKKRGAAVRRSRRTMTEARRRASGRAPCSAPGRWRWWAPAPARTASARGWSSRHNEVRRAVHLVNPRYDRIGELPCVPSLADLDEPVDVVLLGVPDAALADQLAAAAAEGARSAVLFGSAHGLRETDHGDRRPTPAWRCAGRAAWDSSTTRSVCGRWGTSSQIRCREAASASSPIPGRRSRRCCVPAADSDSGLRCRPDRSSSPTPPTTSTTRSTIPERASSRC